jgi:hypothetical protein
MQSRAAVVTVTLLGTVLVAGCATQRSWVYKPNSYASPAAARIRRVVVLPFRDARGNENKNRLAFYLIPLFPYGWVDYGAPEGASAHITSALWVNYKPTEDFPKALADELRASGLFREAYFDFKEGDADLAIQGTIVSTRYQGKVIGYGVSFFAGYLWLLGAPVSTASNDLDVELSCIDTKTSEVFFTKRYAAPQYSATSWIYTMKNDFNYPDMLAGVYRQFTADLARYLDERAARSGA